MGRWSVMKCAWRWPAMLLAVLAFACQPETSPVATQPRTSRNGAVTGPKVVLFVIDGPRYSETFGNPLHEHIPYIWNELRPQGTLCSNFRNLGATLTVSGHATMLTGVWQVLENEGAERPQQPTLFEYFRKATGALPNDAVIISLKPKLEACTYSLDPDYGPNFGALSDLGLATDFATYDRLIERLDQDTPHLVVASFSQVDTKGHSGVWSDYLRQIEIVDSLAALTWNHLQSDPDYADQTYMFIMSDHGRHDDAHGGFQNHGDPCDGCRHLIFLALGPDIRVGYESATLFTQPGICKTVGRILAIPTPQSLGIPLDEIFEPISTGILH